MKEEYQKFGSQLNPLHASAASHARFNGDFFCKETELTRHTLDPSVTDGFFFDLKEHSPEMISSLISLCISSSSEVRNEAKEAISNQQNAKLEKMKIMKEKKLEAASKK